MARVEPQYPLIPPVYQNLRILGQRLRVQTEDGREGVITITPEGDAYLSVLTKIVGGAVATPAPIHAPTPAPNPTPTRAPSRVPKPAPNVLYVPPPVQSSSATAQRFALPTQAPTQAPPQPPPQAPPQPPPQPQTHASAPDGRFGLPMPMPTATTHVPNPPPNRPATGNAHRIKFKVKQEDGKYNVYDGETQMEQSRFTALERAPQQQLKFICIDKLSKMTFYVDQTTNKYFMDYDGEWYSISNN
jgi:hypothetical protein